MPKRPLPPELHRASIRTSSGPDHDVSRKRLRGSDIQHPFTGMSAIGLDLDTVRGRATAFLPVMEAGQVFSHTTALALQGTPLPRVPLELHVSVSFPRTPPRRPGIRGHSLSDCPATLVEGIPVAPPLVAWAQSSVLLSREDLVAVGDHLLRDDSSRIPALVTTAGAWEGRPGAASLRWAAARVRTGVRSRPETHLRLLLVRSRLPEPVVAHPVVVAPDLVLHPDLAYPEARLALEYEGEQHREQRRWERDIERRELFADAGWRTIRVTSSHLYRDPTGLVARIRRHLRR